MRFWGNHFLKDVRKPRKARGSDGDSGVPTGAERYADRKTDKEVRNRESIGHVIWSLLPGLQYKPLVCLKRNLFVPVLFWC